MSESYKHRKLDSTDIQKLPTVQIYCYRMNLSYSLNLVPGSTVRSHLTSIFMIASDVEGLWDVHLLCRSCHVSNKSRSQRDR